MAVSTRLVKRPQAKKDRLSSSSTVLKTPKRSLVASSESVESRLHNQPKPEDDGDEKCNDEDRITDAAGNTDEDGNTNEESAPCNRPLSTITAAISIAPSAEALTGLGQIGMALSETSEFNVKAWALPTYRSSKTALNMLTVVNAVVLAEEGISVVLVAPGFTRTDFTGGEGVKDAGEAAVQIVKAVVDGTPGEFFGKLVDEEGSLEEFGW
ncbi:hypothetical protein BDV12DRAFT_193255 [Aspergillus spectabilis]